MKGALQDDGSLAARIRRTRKDRGLTTSELAALSGVTQGAISQMEAGAIQPSLGTLRRIARALRQPVFWFFLENLSEGEEVVRATERRVVTDSRGAVEYLLLTPDLGGALEVFEMRLQLGAASADEPSTHLGQELLLVLAGTARVELGDKAVELAISDSLTFACARPHRVVNLGTDELRLLCAITPPSF